VTTLQDHFAFQQALFPAVLRMMLRGCRIDKGRRSTLRKDLLAAALERQDLLNLMAGHPLNPRSPRQLQRFFYEDLALPGIKHLTRGNLTTDSAAMDTIATRYPPLLPLCQCITELRSIGVFLSTFIEAETDVDGRMRSSFSIAGPTTYRFSSSTNAFNSGMNLQNLPTGEKQKIRGAKDYITLPNIRELFIPDEGFEFFDMDLDRADLQVVVWEADDADLKLALRRGLDMHLFNAMAVYGFDVPIDELVEEHPKFKEHKARYAKQRQLAKAAVHATNYGVGDRKLAMTLGITVHEAGRFRSRWFGAHPGVQRWHQRTEQQARQRGFIENRFGARLYVWGALDLPEALAWTPQSTVAGVINRGLLAIDQAEQRGDIGVQLLLQVHDSLAGQFPAGAAEASIAALRKLASITIPYDDPLIIPVGIKRSRESWGKCK
jgi:DNA polymerase-1